MSLSFIVHHSSLITHHTLLVVRRGRKVGWGVQGREG